MVSGRRDYLLGNWRVDNEVVLRRNRYRVKRVKAFFQRRSGQLSKGAGDTWNWDFLLTGALVVPSNGIAQRTLKEVRDDAKSGSVSRRNVARSVAGEWICIVDDERLFGLQARCQEKLFALPSPQDVQGDANVSIEKAVQVERGFSGTLNSHKDYRFHQPARELRLPEVLGMLAIFGSFAGRAPFRTAPATGMYVN